MNRESPQPAGWIASKNSSSRNLESPSPSPPPSPDRSSDYVTPELGPSRLRESSPAKRLHDPAPIPKYSSAVANSSGEDKPPEQTRPIPLFQLPPSLQAQSYKALDYSSKTAALPEPSSDYMYPSWGSLSLNHEYPMLHAQPAYHTPAVYAPFPQNPRPGADCYISHQPDFWEPSKVYNQPWSSSANTRLFDYSENKPVYGIAHDAARELERRNTNCELRTRCDERVPSIEAKDGDDPQPELKQEQEQEQEQEPEGETEIVRRSESSQTLRADESSRETTPAAAAARSSPSDPGKEKKRFPITMHAIIRGMIRKCAYYVSDNEHQRPPKRQRQDGEKENEYECECEPEYKIEYEQDPEEPMVLVDGNCHVKLGSINGAFLDREDQVRHRRTPYMRIRGDMFIKAGKREGGDED
ncbi:uncharacterized protein GGS25DRAFT_310515 [Hypoxylon fragiforme]|uniref:uncharacterized protein n=1 Tax=Hypoxylon fragiforme TaxID=63214 RepID=UPI0020C684AD|nr:uncharacterized protein GGS25DRAFT_310515 [Hypoxylon fragiforme]KAI2606865.1 hypothetical protein GGS25DRAFT_310515 [Hypoxylon fragiforme]